MNANGYVYETFGISKRFPVKLQLLLIRAETLAKRLTAKCFIHDVGNSAYVVIHCLGSPTFLSISFAFSNLSGNKTLLSYLFRDLSTDTIGILRFFISVITFISIKFVLQSYYFFLFLRTKNPSYSIFFLNTSQSPSRSPNISKSSFTSVRNFVI